MIQIYNRSKRHYIANDIVDGEKIEVTVKPGVFTAFHEESKAMLLVNGYPMDIVIPPESGGAVLTDELPKKKPGRPPKPKEEIE